MTIREKGKEYPYTLISDSVFNIYNMVTVIAVLRQLGYDHGRLPASWRSPPSPRAATTPKRWGT